MDGEYNLNINGKKFIGHVLNGIGIVNLGIMDTGNYTVQVIFTGNDNYNASANKTTFEVIKTETNFNIIVNDSSITYGDSITVTQSLPGDATGSITYYFANGTIIKVITVDDSFILAGLIHNLCKLLRRHQLCSSTRQHNNNCCKSIQQNNGLRTGCCT